MAFLFYALCCVHKKYEQDEWKIHFRGISTVIMIFVDVIHLIINPRIHTQIFFITLEVEQKKDKKIGNVVLHDLLKRIFRGSKLNDH